MKRWKRKKRNDTNGFTVIEMLVVVGITIILSGMMLGFNRSSEKSIALVTERERVMSILGTARSLALQRKKPGVGFACGYGVKFSGNSVELFGIIRGATSKVNDCVGLEAVNEDTTIETFALEKKATATGVTRIYFSSPYLNTKFFTPDPGVFPAIITISVPGVVSPVSRIEVTSGGAISQKN
ncbi:MAG: type II secretion system protein [Candidatus Paceibacterota bacterium]|jgi:Tfp pilus assembly protein FimT